MNKFMKKGVSEGEARRRYEQSLKSPLGLLRVFEFCQHIAMSRARVYELIREGLLPPPRKRGRDSIWTQREADLIAAAYIGGASDADMKALVAQIVGERAGLLGRTRGEQSTTTDLYGDEEPTLQGGRT
jgi:predicted DNA-binding transcriptional regulator AlpA